MGELEALVADDPLREERWRLLVLALYRSQRQADALAALRRARATLADELGVDPGPALRSLESEVLAQSPALDGPPPPVIAAGAASSAYVAPEDLVDRARETALLHRAVDDLVGGRAACVLVEGPAGIGKSRLLVEAARLAAAGGARVLSARGSPLEQSFGFGTVRQLLNPAPPTPLAATSCWVGPPRARPRCSRTWPARHPCSKGASRPSTRSTG